MRTLELDARALVDPDVGTVDELARLKLAARRRGYELELRNVPRRLEELVEFMGLSEVLGVEPGRKPEEGEEPAGVEEEGELGDSIGRDLEDL